MDFGRREFIKVAIGGLAGFSAVGFEAREGKSEVLASQSRGGAFGTKACKNIIFLVSDGMSAGVLGLAEQFFRMKTGRETNWCRLIRENRCVNGLMDTASLDSLVTDSAAASTAWGSGFRVRNGSINCLPDGTKLTPIAQIAKERGKRIGVVTTATVTHATPAGFAAITPNRDDEFLIASQYLGLVDVALGGGSYFFLPESRLDRKDLVRSFQEHGYTFVENREQLRAVPQNTSKLLGLFSSSHLPYRIDVEGNDFLVGRIPSLAEMTEIALRVLKNSEGFLLQVEGARIDHAAHHNDIATLLREQLEFDQAIGVVLNFVAEYPDTLVIITTDHGNSNPGLNGIGAEYELSTQAFANVLKAKESFFALKMWVSGRLTRPEPLKWDELAQKVYSSLGFPLTQEESQALLHACQNETIHNWNHQHSNYWGLLGQIACNHNGVGWTGTTHTADPVLISALGPMCENFKGFIRNDSVFNYLCQAFGFSV